MRDPNQKNNNIKQKNNFEDKMNKFVEVFSILIDYIPLDEVFRLSRAICFTHQRWEKHDVILMRNRMGVPKTVPLSKFLMTFLDRPRCRKCGRTCYATQPRYCRNCTTDEKSDAFLVDRRFIRKHVRAHNIPKKMKNTALTLIFNKTNGFYVKTGSNRAHMYWFKDIDRLLSQICTQVLQTET